MLRPCSHCKTCITIHPPHPIFDTSWRRTGRASLVCSWTLMSEMFILIGLKVFQEAFPGAGWRRWKHPLPQAHQLPCGRGFWLIALHLAPMLAPTTRTQWMWTTEAVRTLTCRFVCSFTTRTGIGFAVEVCYLQRICHFVAKDNVVFSLATEFLSFFFASRFWCQGKPAW